jgi:hypothetical protein
LVHATGRRAHELGLGAAAQRDQLVGPGRAPASSATAAATEQTTAAEEDKPAPTGTLLSMCTRSPGTGRPDSRTAHTEPAG